MRLTDGWTLCGIKILDEKTKLLPIYFHSIGHYPGQRHVFRPSGLGQYQLAICTKGCGVFASEGQEYNIKEGDMFFVSPDTSHEYYPVDNSWTVIWVVFNGKDVEGIMKYFEFKPTFVKHADEDNLKRIIGLCETLYETYNKNESYDFLLTVTMQQLMYCLSLGKDVTSKLKSENNDVKISFSPVIDFIKKNYMHNLSLEDIAKECELSKSHFCRLFKKEYGITPMIYLNRYRISVAKFLLATTVESVDVIAGKTGFSDTSYFCAVFRKTEGCSPVQYRKRHEQ